MRVRRKAARVEWRRVDGWLAVLKQRCQEQRAAGGQGKPYVVMPDIEPQVLMQERPSDDGEAVDDAGPASPPRSALDRRAERGPRLGRSHRAIALAEVPRGGADRGADGERASRYPALARPDPPPRH